ncbi:MAG: hypothetical protein M1814_002092 [Vezdaea aestivalis]|nr:MAG: hypothetical protein M1814_002092 [Vezdaea aestivalis]
MPIQQAVVKSVISGDTVVLTSLNNSKRERTLYLAYTIGPRLKKDGDEPFAFESREFLRTAVLGKVVKFQVLYEIPSPHTSEGKREYGRILLPDGTRFPEAAVSEGWMKVRGDATRQDDNEEATALLEKLRVTEAKAKAESKNMWSSQNGLIAVENGISDYDGFVAKWKGKQLSAIIERVLSGDRLSARLLTSPTKHVSTLVVIAGIRAPMKRRVSPSDGKETPAEPLADEAHEFVEARLLQRKVDIEVVGLTSQPQLIAVIRHPNGIIAEFILKEGLAKCTDFHSTMLGERMAALRSAEKYARDNKKGLYKSHVEPRGAAKGSIEATISRVQSADTLYLRNKAGGEKRINLSSVRQPKPTDPKQSIFCAEAKEFLRKRLIGKHVRVTIDGKRPPQEGFDEREMATIVHNGTNISLLLVENGWAQVIRHRRDDTDRSPIYDELLAAEAAAQGDQKGMWSSNAPPLRLFEDISETAVKAKQRFTLLSRQKRIPAIVDFVKSSARFTILIPRESQKLTLVLGGIRAPKTARNESEKTEPFGQESYDLAVRRLLQRDVEIEVEGTDKVGGFIGTLWINRDNFAKILVEEGFATVHAYSAEGSAAGQELFAAERNAQESHKGRWHDWTPEKNDRSPSLANLSVSEKPSNGTSEPRRKDYRDVMITHVEPNGRLKVQLVGTLTSKLETITTALRAFHGLPANNKALAAAPKVGDSVSAKFSADGSWYRGRIRANDHKAKSAEVVYIDYGNTEKQPWSALRALPSQFSTAELRANAFDAQLSFIALPTEPNYLQEAIERIYDLTADLQLVANVDAEADNTLYVTLFDPKASKDAGDSLNATLVKEGFATVPKNLKAWEKRAPDVVKSLKGIEEKAIEARAGMWEYGDLRED